MSDEPQVHGATPMVISTTMSVRMLGIDGTESDQAIRWEYLPADPFVLKMTIVPGSTIGAVWSVSREALWDAVRRGVGKGMIGAGDVRFEVTTGRVRVYLYGADGSWARINFTRDALWVYLRSTEAIVPVGEEHKHYDLDAELRKLQISAGLLPGEAGCDTARADAEEQTGDGEGVTPMD